MGDMIFRNFFISKTSLGENSRCQDITISQHKPGLVLYAKPFEDLQQLHGNVDPSVLITELLTTLEGTKPISSIC